MLKTVSTVWRRLWERQNRSLQNKEIRNGDYAYGVTVFVSENYG
jgi:hypothetical protein